ncbi:MAG: hypothetical protein KF726_08330 [Anaerolineae bacterium]|nr:hypothetical protein [Anaerolineae bacterium]
MHNQTDWQIVPNFAFDTLCLLNALTGDEFYLTYYQREYDHFAPLIELDADARQAMAELTRKVKIEGKEIISAFFCLYFSAVEVEDIDDLLTTLQDTSALHRNFAETAYFDPEGEKLFESVKPELGVILRFLQSVNVEQYWRDHFLPAIEAKIAEIGAQLPQYNIVPLVERHLGTALADNRITVYMLGFTQPHGIRIVGTRYLTDVSWPFRIVLSNAVHEMLHPPYRLDDELLAQLQYFKDDTFVMDKVLNHNPAFGYNTFEGYIEEDCVQALDQYLNEKLGVAKDAVKRWQDSDDGMHVLALVLNNKMKEQNFPQNGESFRTFLMRLITSGQLADIKRQYERIVAAAN